MDIKKYKKIGKFTLSSGEGSDYYYDIKEAMGDPKNLRDIIEYVNSNYVLGNIDLIVGIAYGGVPIAIGLSLMTGLPYAILRSEKKTHGTQKRLEGFQDKIWNRVILVDDVKNTGKSLKEAKKYLKSEGYTIVATYVFMDRNKVK